MLWLAVWFCFTTPGTDLVSLSATDATDILTPGVADDVGTLRSVLAIFNSSGVPVGTSTEEASTLVDDYSGVLSSGSYYAEPSKSKIRRPFRAGLDA